MPYSIPANAEGNIRIKKKDGTYVYNPALGCNSDGTVLYFEVTHQIKDTDISNLINQLAGYKITTKMEDSDGNYVTDANGDYIETVVLLVNPDDLLSILERVVALEKAVYEK